MALNVVKIFTTKLIFSCNLRLLNEDLPLKNRMLANIYILYSHYNKVTTTLFKSKNSV